MRGLLKEDTLNLDQQDESVDDKLFSYHLIFLKHDYCFIFSVKQQTKAWLTQMKSLSLFIYFISNCAGG